MNAAVVALLCFALYGLAYVAYGRYLARRVFDLSPDRVTAAHRYRDGIDFVPTPVPVLFGHHFATIAGLGPILGPAIAVIWGWGPAILWVVLGAIFIGAVHDLGALTVSLRYDGRSIGDVCRDLVGQRARLLFLVLIFFLMSLAMGNFVVVISSLYIRFQPDAVLPSIGATILAAFVGLAVYRWKLPLGPTTWASVALFFALIGLGAVYPIPIHHLFLTSQTRAEIQGLQEAGGIPPSYGAFPEERALRADGKTRRADEVQAAAVRAEVYTMWVLLAYGYLASVLPVWLLLQPRDYINSFLLCAALLLMLAGLIVAALKGSERAVIDAPLVRTVGDAPPIIPFLFVTIACGAVSGFHSLVSSGTTVRQLDRETHALPIGFGAMLTEGALAVLVILACVAGLEAAEWGSGGIYSSWSLIGGGDLSVRLRAVVQGAGNFLNELGISSAYAEVFLAVTIVAFALTTLDSATRLLRFNVEEILRAVGAKALANRYVGSAVAVAGIAWFAFSEGGKSLWILFGTTNQLLAGLTLLTVSAYLYWVGKVVWYTAVPMVLILGMTIYAMVLQLGDFLAAERPNPALVSVSIGVLLLAVWLVVEVILACSRATGARRQAVERIPAVGTAEASDP
jgi:carbon starvation protein